MTRLHSTLAALLFGALTLPALPGCDEGGGSASGDTPKPGSYVHVHYRKQHLGISGDKPTTPMSEGLNMNLASSGELRVMTDDYVVLKADGEAGRELWIPRDVILMLDVRAKAE